MNLIFTDLYEQEVREIFGITRNHVRDAINSPDSQSVITLDEFEIVYYIKRILHSKGEIYLLVATRKIAEDIFVDLAFRILPELINDLNTIEPIIILQELIQRFGLTIRIGYQLNKFIVREIIPIDNSISDETQLVQIINPNNHSFLQAIFLKFENQGNKKVVNCAMAFCIDTDDYSNWLQGKLITKRSENIRKDVEVEIAPQIRGHLTPIDLIRSSGTITFITAYSEITGNKSGFLFKLSSEKYSFEMGFDQNKFYMLRNNQKIEKPIDPNIDPSSLVRCYAIWSPQELSLLMLDDSYSEFISSTNDYAEQIREIEKRKATHRTPITIPPNNLIDWARKESVAPVTFYDNKEHFFETVTNSILAVQDTIKSISLHNPFWDISYDRLKIISRNPKHETDIHPTIHGLIRDISIARNFQISPEYSIAGGNLDFLLSGTLKSGENVSVCIEFKPAHSNDIENGLAKQLPAYMRAKGCDYGLYCVLWFKGPFFSYPKEEMMEFELSLQKILLQTGLQNIRIITLDLSQQTPPSKL